MRVFRAQDRLSVGIAKFEVFLESQLKPEAIPILLRKQRITEVRMPPLLAMLPEYEELFREWGVTTFSELFDSELASESVKCEALALFQPENAACSCGRL